MNNVEQNIYSKIRQYRKKYFLNLAVKGLLISLGLTFSIFLIFNTLEYSFRFGSLIRAILLFLFVGVALWAMGKYVVIPLISLLKNEKAMSDEEAAKKIGQHFPEINDKLLNIIQLQKFQGALVQASILQKSDIIASYEFTEAVDFKRNRSYVKYLVVPLVVLLSVLIISPSFITSSSSRIIEFNREFVPEAPFSFELENDELIAFKNEDFNLKLNLDGDVLPENAYIVLNDRMIKMSPEEGSYTYTFSKIQDDKNFSFQAAGYNSSTYHVKVVDRPNIKNFNVYLDYPAYLGKKNERLNNTGNLQIPEGTQVKWQLKTIQSEEATIGFDKSDSLYTLQNIDNQVFEFEKQFFNSQIYSLNLKNQYSNNKEKILYKIDVVKDQYPEIDLSTYQDTTMYNYIALGGNISDDYGLTQLKLFYTINEKGKNGKGKTKSINIAISKNQNSQRYYYQWFLDSLNIEEGNSINYYLQVWDNDGVNGRKSAKTGTYSFKLPTKSEIKDQVDKTNAKTEKDIDKTIKDAQELKEKIKEAENRLKGKKDLNWQEENLLKDIIEKKEELNKSLEELKEQNKNNQDKRNRFSEENKNISEKSKQLQKLMDELLDDETKKLYEELKKLLEEKDIDDIQNTLDQIDNKEENLEQELERTLELFKRMQFDQKLDDAISELDDQIKKQEELSEKTDDKSSDKEELAKEQEELQKDFEEFKKDKEELEEMNQELKNPESLPDTQEEEEQIEQEQQNAKESLEKNKKKKASESQQNVKQQMQKMKEKMQQMQSGMEMTMMQENLDDLRDIVHNLLKLSFDQEDLMKEFKNVQQSDPRFVDLGQTELKLRDDAKIVQDSLLSLANRVFQIATFVTREVGEMNDHMDKSVKAIKDRKKPIAVSEQQFAMTSMNNLALLLDDVLEQMMNAMQDAQGQGQSKQKGKQKTPSLSQLQKELNNKINDLKKSGKSGRELSEELAKLAAEQQRIRQQMQEMQEKYGESGNKPGDGLPEKMEETETDLVNKQITQETINRQKEILTRMLEAEDAMREREQDEERKAESAKDYEKALPKAFEEYFKLKEKEVELLKTVPPKLYPYYKQEVNEYFKRLGNKPNN
ncbi:hypothetical protein LVD15_07485 [Fulvivirga maritima]|uniref:DUF4175 family protein n=1 Tax=Fulvivirga maritima TaxID=2904247 RepID=UPI001F46E9BB|nr:DUF4175 family protein [Fulvivirga maritima]UII28259.1 hypothetical protein LVD15_07485 [Fulvivirga maritima]